jgi:DnaD/phage-associated family protein
MYRPIDIEFWQDDFILDLSPEHKLSYLFLLTNRRTTQCGIYNIGLTIAQVELQFSEEKIIDHLKFFQDKGKILYNDETKEVMILNWHKYNNIHNHKNIRICINKELKRVKTAEFINAFYEICKRICKEEPTLLKEIFKDIDLEDEALKMEIEEDKEEKVTVHNEENKDKQSAKNKVLECFKNNFHLPSFIEIEKLKQWVEDMGEPLVLRALEEAICVNKRNLNYVSGILNNWLSEGITTVEEAEDVIKKFRDFKKNTVQKDDNSGSRFYSKNLAEVDYGKE